MANPELLQLLDSVLAGEIPEIPVFEQRVSRITAIIRSMDAKEVKSVQSLIHQGTQEGRYDRSNSELVLMYLQGAMRGSSASLRLHTKKSRRRREETETGETGNAPVQGDPSIRLTETEPDDLQAIRDDTKDFLKPFWDRKVSVGSHKSSLHHSISPRSRSRDFGAVRTLTSELERIRAKAIGQGFRRLLSNDWAARLTETAAQRKHQQKLAAFKRLINHLRKALIYPKQVVLSRWRVESDGPIPLPDLYLSLKRLLTISKSSFFQRKLRFFARWKGLSQPLYRPVSVTPSLLKRSTPRGTRKKRAAKTGEQSRSITSPDLLEKPAVSHEALELWKRLTMERWRETKSPAAALSTALLRRADKTLKMALNRVMVVNRLSTIQHFGLALARLDHIIAPMDIAMKVAYLTWHRAVPRVRKERIRATLYLALRVYKRLLRVRLITWRTYIRLLTQHLQDQKVLKVIHIFTRILQNRAQPSIITPTSGAETDRTHRSSSKIYYEKHDIDKKALKTIISTFGKGLKMTLQHWFLVTLRHKSGNQIAKIAVFGAILDKKIRESVSFGFRILEEKMKVEGVKSEHLLLVNNKKPLLEVMKFLGNLRIKAVLSHFQTLKGLRNKQKTGIIRVIYRAYELQTLKALKIWKNNTISSNLTDLYDENKGKIAKSGKFEEHLMVVWRRKIREIMNKTLRNDRSKLELAAKMIQNSVKNNEKTAFEALKMAILKEKRVDKRFEKMKNALEKSGKRTIRPVFTHLLSRYRLFKTIIRSLSKIFTKTTQNSLLIWYKNSQKIVISKESKGKKYQLLLKNALNRTFRVAFSHIQANKQAKVKSALRRLSLFVSKSLEKTLNQWKIEISSQNSPEILKNSPKNSKMLKKEQRKALKSGISRNIVTSEIDEIAGNRLFMLLNRLGNKQIKAALGKIRDSEGKIMKKSLKLMNLVFLRRPREGFNVWKYGKSDNLAEKMPENRQKLALKSIISVWNNQIKSLLQTFRLKIYLKNTKFGDRAKGEILRNLMNKISLKGVKKAAEKVLFEENLGVNFALLELKTALSKPLNSIFAYFRMLKFAKSPKGDVKSVSSMVKTLQNCVNAGYSCFFSVWKSDKRRLGGRFQQKIGLLVRHRKEVTLQRVSALGALHTVTSRIQAAQRLLSASRRTDVYLLRTPLRKWCDVATERTRKLRLKSAVSFIYNTSLSYQTSFWRWSLIRPHGEVIFPHQLSFLKNVARVLSRAERNGVYMSLVVLRCGRPVVSSGQTRSVSPFSLHRHSTSGSRRSSNSLEADEAEFVNPETIHTIVNNKLTGVEMNMVRQMGAAETLGLVLRTAFARNKVAAFVSIKDEAELNEMKECNDLLMSDMVNLQEGNKQIMEAFKESTLSLEALSRKLDVMRTERVVKVLGKVGSVLPAYEAFLMIKLHAGLPLF